MSGNLNHELCHFTDFDSVSILGNIARKEHHMINGIYLSTPWMEYIYLYIYFVFVIFFGNSFLKTMLIKGNIFIVITVHLCLQMVYSWNSL